MIAIDAMGGDFAPKVVVEGAVKAAKQSVPVVLFGHESSIRAHLSECDPLWSDLPIFVEHTQTVVGMDEDPVSAVRQKSDSSMVMAVRSVKEGRCSSVISAGNSGALMAAATLLLGRQEGVLRPAIAGLLPTADGFVVGLDLGANTACRPEHLAQFAVMGSQYAESILDLKRQPRVGLLANGHEPGKGSPLTKEAFKLIEHDARVHFVGNVEPIDIFVNRGQRSPDVVVCDGFSGNVLLKTMESMYAMFVASFKQAIASENNATSALWGKQFLQKMAQKADGRKRGGALLLGVNGNAMVCHGNADSYAIEQAIIRCNSFGIPRNASVRESIQHI